MTNSNITRLPEPLVSLLRKRSSRAPIRTTSPRCASMARLRVVKSLYDTPGKATLQDGHHEGSWAALCRGAAAALLAARQSAHARGDPRTWLHRPTGGSPHSLLLSAPRWGKAVRP